jgi:hypothetical protein
MKKKRLNSKPVKTKSKSPDFEEPSPPKKKEFSASL